MRRFFAIALICMLVGSAGMQAKDIILPRRAKKVAAVMTEPNARYIVKKKINLKGKTIAVPAGCELVFENGYFTNGVIVGNNTSVGEYKKDIFGNCTLSGSWECRAANSRMFDSRLETTVLLKNLTLLSEIIQLYADRKYVLDREDLTLSCSSISSIGDGEAVIEFHTSNPNKCGLLFSSDEVDISKLIFRDDYEKNKGKFVDNDHRDGSTLGTSAPRGRLQTIRINECMFEGGTYSSYFASSTTKDCLVQNCIFTGYMADHAVYCSTNIEEFSIKNTVLKDVPNTTGLFKVRSSRKLKDFKLDSLTVRNLNGYLAVAELMPSGASINISNVEVSKDEDKDYQCFGVCIVKDARGGNKGDVVDAKSIVFENCRFDYGYAGHPLIARGTGVKVKVETIVYRNVKARDLSCKGDIARKRTVIE